MSWDPVQEPTVHSCHVPLVSSNLWQFLVFPYFSWLWCFWRVWSDVLWNVSPLGFVWCFLMIRLGLWIWGGKYHRGEGHHIRRQKMSTRLIPGDGNLVKVVFDKLFHSIVPTFIATLFLKDFFSDQPNMWCFSTPILQLSDINRMSNNSIQFWHQSPESVDTQGTWSTGLPPLRYQLGCPHSGQPLQLQWFSWPLPHQVR